ncbi:MAG: hypothetical protein DBX47_04700 [Clostridiales bacterium]|nr:MAG: hypothetical protein DBX47_04700 [Clostridiales bacterium]
MTELYPTFEETFREIPILLIDDTNVCTRETFNESSLDDLSRSISSFGVIEPLTVRAVGEKYELIAGRRRFLAARMAGVYSIPCVVTEIDEPNACISALSSNINCEPMHYFDIAQAIAHIVRTLGFSEEYTAKKLGKSTLYIKNKLKLLAIPEYIRDYIIENHLKEKHTRCILRLDDEKLMLRAATAAVRSKMNVGQLDAYVDTLLEKKGINISFCRDLRLYFNTINHTVNIMKNSGINTLLEKIEDEHSVTYRIVVNK